VMTDRGDTLIHMRISDAEALLAKADGLRVHRSHWVARVAVINVSRKRGQIVLLLANGQSAPVSRSRLEVLANAGWPVMGA
jgi:DNA-binding LytR/AlgR family response regulator